jgi:hypothetical protein
MVSLPTFTLLSASVKSAILHVRSPRGHLKDRLLSVLGHTLVASKSLVTNSPSRSLETSRRSILPAGDRRFLV